MTESDEYADDPNWEYGFRADNGEFVCGAVFGLPFTSLAMVKHTGSKSYWDSIEYLRHPKGSRSTDDWEAVTDD